VSKQYEPWLVYKTPYGKRYFSLQRLWARKWVKMLTLATVTISVPAYQFLKPVLAPVYKRWRAEQFDAQARRFLDSGNLESAGIAARNAIQRAGPTAERYVILARSQPDAEGALVPTLYALAWDADRTNESLAVVALHEAAVRRAYDVGDWLAPRVIRAFPTNAALFFAGSAIVGLRGDVDRAAALCRRAVELSPTNSDYRLALASLDLSTGQSNRVAEAEKALSDLAALPAYKVRALTLLATFRSATDPQAALEDWKQIVAADPANFGATLSQLTIQWVFDPASTAAEIERLRPRATNLAQRVQLIQAAFTLQGPKAARPLLALLTPEDLREVPAMTAQIAVAAAEAKWNEVLSVVRKADGVPLSDGDKLVLLVWRFRAETMMNSLSAASATRIRALELARSDAQQAFAAAQQLEQWGFPREACEFLEIPARSEGAYRSPAIRELLRLAPTARDAKRSLFAAEELSRTFPNEPMFGNNVADALLILGQDPARALKLADAARERYPNFAPVLDTYARALTVSGRVPEALAIYRGITSNYLADPTIRLNYADALRRSGLMEEASQMVAPITAGDVYPEQAKLLEEVRSSVKPK
jgi:tetratricopeptide (TPR) repeat protein